MTYPKQEGKKILAQSPRAIPLIEGQARGGLHNFFWVRYGGCYACFQKKFDSRRDAEKTKIKNLCGSARDIVCFRVCAANFTKEKIEARTWGARKCLSSYFLALHFLAEI